jgi:hypothetical protein
VRSSHRRTFIVGCALCLLVGSALAVRETRPSLGVNTSLNGWRPFPADDAWNRPIIREPIDPLSDVYIRQIGPDKPLHADFGQRNGIPYIILPGNTPKVPVTFTYAEESDPGPYPVPLTAPIEDGAASSGDRHVIAIDRDNWKLYEMHKAYPKSDGWQAGSGATFDLAQHPSRPAGFTSADAAGLPIFPGLARYDEAVGRRNIFHALRFTVKATRRAYVAPATHYASRRRERFLPPMGMRVRLKANFDISSYPLQAQAILKCLKIYGMILADNGSDWFISGAPDPRWNASELQALRGVKGSDLEVVKMGPITTD